MALAPRFNLAAQLGGLLAVAGLTGCCFTPVAEGGSTAGGSAAGRIATGVGATCPLGKSSMFGAQVAYTVGFAPTSVAVGDFNGDGKPDLAVANMNSAVANMDGTVSVLLNAGGGTFSPQVTYPVGSTNSTCVAVGDFNGDGKPDLAVATWSLAQNGENGSGSVLLNQGGGAFGAPMIYSTGYEPSSVAVGDFNGDGKPDLAVADPGDNTLSVLLNEGGGRFAEAVPYVIRHAPDSVAVGDFNGDGKPDLAVAIALAGTVDVLLNQGDGTFGAPMIYVLGSDPSSVAVGDFNGDGKPDLAVTDDMDATVSVLLNQGGGTFSARMIYRVGSGSGSDAASVAVGDFNGDGMLDLAVANEFDGTVSVLLNQGGETFGPQTLYAVGSEITSEPTSVAVGDFNGDGRPDLAIANGGDNTVVVLLNGCQ